MHINSNDCIGSWQPCNQDCKQMYKVHSYQYDNGKPCPYIDNEIRDCQCTSSTRAIEQIINLNDNNIDQLIKIPGHNIDILSNSKLSGKSIIINPDNINTYKIDNDIEYFHDDKWNKGIIKKIDGQQLTIKFGGMICHKRILHNMRSWLPMGLQSYILNDTYYPLWTDLCKLNRNEESCKNDTKDCIWWDGLIDPTGMNQDTGCYEKDNIIMLYIKFLRMLYHDNETIIEFCNYNTEEETQKLINTCIFSAKDFGGLPALTDSKLDIFCTLHTLIESLPPEINLFDLLNRRKTCANINGDSDNTDSFNCNPPPEGDGYIHLPYLKNNPEDIECIGNCTPAQCCTNDT